MRRVAVLVVLITVLAPGAGRGASSVPAAEIVFTRTVGTTGHPSLYVISSDGSRLRLLARNAAEAAVSSDGRRIAFVRTRAIWVMRRDGSAQRQVTKPGPGEGAFDATPAWSPDGRTLYFSRSRSWTDGSIFSIRDDGTRLRRLTRGSTSNHGRCQERPAPSPDGRLIAYAVWFDCEHGTAGGISAVKTSGHEVRLPFSFPPVDTFDPAWSPDGRQLAYAGRDPNTASAGWGLYVSAASPSRPRPMVAGPWIEKPAWSPDDTLIAFERDVVEPNGYPGDVWIVRPDGKGVQRLTHTRADDKTPAWLSPAK